jgi:spoIIIJ-associated protein
MEVLVYEGKTEEEVLAKALKELNVTDNDVLYKYETQKGKLFKASTIKLSIIKLEDIQSFLKEFLQNLLKQMGLSVNFESSLREKQINIKMYSDNNPILIGKNGQTLTALTTICKQAVFAQIGLYPYLNLDVENYKDKQIMHLERLAKNIAREVRETKKDVIMDNMNAYERRIVHNCLSEFQDISTESEGDEPNRHIVVKIKKD